MQRTLWTGLGVVLIVVFTITACGGGGSSSGGGGKTLTSIVVTPANTTIATSATQQFTAAGTYSDGSKQDLTASATWKSSDDTRATVNSAGLVTAASNAAGSTTITATSGGISGSAVFNVIVNLPKTGQTACYDASGNTIACTGTGEDGALQEGVAWPSPRFTTPSNGTITDNLTGLMWTQNGNAPGTSSCNPGVTMTWQAALNYVACLNTNSYLGYTNWRLPNIIELSSLHNYNYNGQLNGWLNSQGFSSVQAGKYWSSTTWDSGVFGMAFYTDMSTYDYARASNDKTYDYYVWPVRTSGTSGTIALPKTGQTLCYDASGNQYVCIDPTITTSYPGEDGALQEGVAWPSPRFTTPSNGTIMDNLTGLIWPQNGNAPGPSSCNPGVTMTWQAALNYVACLNTNSYLGYTNWRLPNVNELTSVITYAGGGFISDLTQAQFTNMQASPYWSSTTWAIGLGDAVIVGFGDGGTNYSNKTTGNWYVWPVCGGQ